MFDIYDDELNQMYEKEGKSGNKIGKGVSLNDPLNSLKKQTIILLEETVSLRSAIDNIQKFHVGCILLEKDNVISGIFTERDIVQRVVGHRLDFESEKVLDFMTQNPETLYGEDPIAFALNKMVAGGFRHIPIVNMKKKAIGVIAMQDIINNLGDYFFEDIVNLPPKPLRKQTQREGG